MKQVVLFFLVFQFFASFTYGQTHNAINEKTRQKIDSTYQSLIDKHKITGLSLAIVDDGKIVYSTGYGFSDAEKVTPAGDETVYRIGSTTKVITSLAVMQLHEKGEINYQNSIREYIPELDMPNRFGDQNQLHIPNIMAHQQDYPAMCSTAFSVKTHPIRAGLSPI